jgi:GT2 family glycosyltransferase
VADGEAAPATAYARWARAAARARSDPSRAWRRLHALPRRPRVSIVVWAHDPEPGALEATIASVAAQVYPDWELLARLGPEALRPLVADPRMRIERSDAPEGGARGRNEALRGATGELVATVEAGDRLAPDALLEAVEALVASDAEALYADADRIGADGERAGPELRPDWSPDLLESRCYTTGLGVFRRALLERLGGWREGFEGAEEHDLWLRVARAAGSVAHVPAILCHSAPRATAVEPARRAVADATGGRVEDGLAPGTFFVRRPPRGEPLVSILIPTRDRLDLLERCVRGVETRTAWRAWEIVIVDNGSREPATLDWLARTRHRVVRDDGDFNYSRLNNAAARAARGDLLLLLNNDTEPLHEEWLEALVEHAVRPEVGPVGAKLLYADGTVQHAGVVLGPAGVAGHALRRLPGDDPGGPDLWNATVRNLNAVTGACLMVRRAVWDELGGLDESLAASYNDVDFCLRARARGWRVIWTPHARLLHDESQSRGIFVDQSEVTRVRERWGRLLERDPFYGPNRFRDDARHEAPGGLEFSKPDGVWIGAELLPGDHAALELDRGRRLVAGVDARRDRLAGVTLWTDSDVQGDVPLGVHLLGDGGEVQARASAAATGAGAMLFVLFPAELPAGRYRMSVEAEGPLRLRAGAPGVPAWRLVHR